MSMITPSVAAADNASGGVNRVIRWAESSTRRSSDPGPELRDRAGRCSVLAIAEP
jgi:hypothetical protein